MVNSSNSNAGGNFPAACRDEREWYLARIEPETSRRMENEVSQAHMVITLLASANAGGAVAMLAYIAQLTSSGAQMIPSAKSILAAYGVGFGVALLLAVMTYYASLQRLVRWNKRVSAFYRGDNKWQDLWRNATPWYGGWLLHVLGLVSLACFIGASWFGITQMLDANKATSSTSPPRKEATAPRKAIKLEQPRSLHAGTGVNSK